MKRVIAACLIVVLTATSALAGTCTLHLRNECWAKMVAETTFLGGLNAYQRFVGPASQTVKPDAVMQPGTTGLLFFRAYPTRTDASLGYVPRYQIQAPNVENTGGDVFIFQPIAGVPKAISFTYEFFPGSEVPYHSEVDGTDCTARQLVITAKDLFGSGVPGCDPSDCVMNELGQPFPQYYDATLKTLGYNLLEDLMRALARLTIDYLNVPEPFKSRTKDTADEILRTARQVYESLKDPSDNANWNVFATLGQPKAMLSWDAVSGLTPPQKAALNQWSTALAAIGPYLELWRVSLDRMSGAIQMQSLEPVQGVYWKDQHRQAAQQAAGQAATLITTQLIPAMKEVAKRVKGNATHAIPASQVGVSDAAALVTGVSGVSYREADNALIGGLSLAPTTAAVWPTAFVDTAAQATWQNLATYLSATICPTGTADCQ